MTTPSESTFGEVLRHHRTAAHLTQAELAELAHLSVRGINDLERGARTAPRRETVHLLADALDLQGGERIAFTNAARGGSRRRIPSVMPGPAAPSPPRVGTTAPASLSAPADLTDAAEIVEGTAEGTAAEEPAAIRTFLIADVRGYTRFMLDQGDEQAAQMASRLAELARQVVTHHQGRVLELRGDEALAVFTSARRALRAAVTLQAAFQKATAENAALPLPVGIGLDAGEAVPVEGGYRGAALNLAARLCAVAAAGETLASETVLNLARRVEGLVYEARDPVVLKGFAEPVRYACVSTALTHTVTPATTSLGTGHLPDRAGSRTDGLAEQTTRLPVGGFLGALPEGPLVAREMELGHIGAALETVDAGAGRLLLLAGEPGVGKTRLAQEAMVAARERGFLVASGRCYEPQMTVGYYPFLEALHHALSQAPGQVRRAVGDRWPDVVRLLPEETLRSQNLSARLASTREQGDDQQRLFWQVTSFLQTLAAVQPVTLLLDDLHWADEASLDLLAHLARHTHGDRVLLLGVYRDVEVTRQHPLEGVLRDLGRERLIERIAVHRLLPEGTRTLIGATLGMDEVSEEFAGLLHERAEGNPFFTGELLRDLIERGAVYRDESGHWGWHEIEQITVPDGVRSVIGQRIGRLASQTQEALTEAAILGQVFVFEELVGMTGRAEEEVEGALDEATVGGLIREDEGRNRTAGAYTFAHVLIQQTLYTGLTARRRRRLHRAAGEVIERLLEPARVVRAAELAWHFLEAGDPARALPYALLAGDQAGAVFAHHEAEKHFRGACDVARQLDDHVRLAEALEKLADVLDMTGRHNDARAAYEQVLALHRAALLPSHESRWLGHLHFRIGLTYNSQRRLDEAEDACKKAEAALGRIPDETAVDWWQAWLDIQMLRITLYYWQGQISEMMALTQIVQPVLERCGTPGQRVEFYNTLAISNARRDRYVISLETLRFAQAGLDGAVEEGNLKHIAEMQFGLGFTMLWYGDLDGAEKALKASLQLADRVGTGRFGDLSNLGLTYLTVVYRKRGQLDTTQRCAEEALAVASALQLPSYIGIAHANLGWVAWRRGDLAMAVEHCRVALEEWPKSKLAAYPFQWTALWPLISLAYTENRLGDAIEHARVMLSPLQQRLPDELNALVETAVQAWDDAQPDVAGSSLDKALNLALATGYL